MAKILMFFLLFFGSYAPIFNRNYVLSTSVRGSSVSVISEPYELIDESPGGEVRVFVSGKISYKFKLKKISGSLFVPSPDGKTIAELPARAGFVTIRKQQRKVVTPLVSGKIKIKFYSSGVLYDSVLLHDDLAFLVCAKLCKTNNFKYYNKNVRVSNEKLFIREAEKWYAISFSNMSIELGSKLPKKSFKTAIKIIK